MAGRFAVRSLATLRSSLPSAIVVAGVLTVLSSVEWLVPALRAEPGETAVVNVRRPPRSLSGPTDVAVRTDLDVIRNERVDAGAHADVLAWQRDRVAGIRFELPAMFLLHVGVLLTLSFYLRRFGRGLARFRRAHFVNFVSIGVIAALFKAYLLFAPWTPYLFPLAAGGFALAHHLGRRAGITILLALGIIGASFVGWDLAFGLATTAQGLAVGVLLQLHRRRSRRLALIGLVGGIASLAVVAVSMFASGRPELYESALFLPYANPLAGAFGGALLAGLLAWVLAVPVGLAVGVISRSRLLDLQDIEHPLLKRLRERAPGTWEHSRSMANLAEAVASAVGGDAVLARVGAYFHDVGKSVEPGLFIENITGEPGQEQKNPHEGMDPKDSADRIVEHVVAGVERLRHYRIPEAITDFVYMHHGTSLIEYFWGKVQENGNPHGYATDDFRYPGMRPQTRETGILMIVDAVEAASRTVHPPTREKFRAAVERIVLGKLAQGQLDESGLRLEDLHVAMDVLVDAIVHGHHERVAYPWQKKAEEEAREAEAEKAPAPAQPAATADAAAPETAPPPERRTAPGGTAAPVAALAPAPKPVVEKPPTPTES